MALYANRKKTSCLLYGVLRNSKDVGRVERGACRSRIVAVSGIAMSTM